MRRTSGEAIVAADPVGTSRRLISVQVADVHAGSPFDRLTVDMTRRDEGQAIDELLKALGYPPKPTVQQDGGPVPSASVPAQQPAHLAGANAERGIHRTGRGARAAA